MSFGGQGLVMFLFVCVLKPNFHIPNPKEKRVNPKTKTPNPNLPKDAVIQAKATINPKPYNRPKNI